MNEISAERITEAELWRRYGKAEGATLEFKVSLIKAGKLQDSVVAFANTRGGTILVGIAERPARVTGIEWGQAEEERVQEVARITNPPIPIESRSFVVDGRTIGCLRVLALESGWVQTSDGRLIVRAGPTNRTLVGGELLRFVTERAAGPVEDQVVPGAKMADLDNDRSGEFLTARLGRREFDTTAELINLGFVAPGEKIRLATLLLFGVAPQTRGRRFGIDVLRHDGSIDARGTLLDRQQIVGPLPVMVERAYEVIHEHMRRDAIRSGLLRQEVPEYPPQVLREALLNAVGHRDYSLSGSAVQVRLFADGLEIESPGSLAAWVTVENLRDAQYSRNPRIMDAFHVLKLVEEAGTGIDTMYTEMEDALLDPPEFEERDHAFLVRLRSRGVFSVEDRAWISSFSDLRLSAAAKVALVFARQNGAITNPDLRRLRHLDSAESRSTLQDLVARGLLVALGERRGTRYVLSDLASARRASARSGPLGRVIDWAREHETVANADVRKLLGVDESQARALLQSGVERGLLKTVGERRGRRYLPT